MIVRRIRAGELKRCAELSAVAFECPMERPEQDAGQWAREIVESPKSLEDVHWDARWAAFEDDDVTMMATFAVLPWRANFDGREVGMAGVGGVASLPQYRRGGAVRACFEAALKGMYEDGMVLSYLYPFSDAFYRRFGYELGCDSARWRLRLELLPRGDVPGCWRLSEPGNTLEADVRAIDDLRQRRYNLMVIAGDTEYGWLRENGLVSRRYTYVYYDGEGRPSAYMTLVPRQDRDLDCPRFAFNDAAGFLGLLALLRRFASDHAHAHLWLPVDVDPAALLPEFSLGGVERALEQRGMVRVVNVAEVLRLARAKGEGRLTVAVRDEHIPENDGLFRVDFAPGRENRVEKLAQGGADIELSIQDFSRLITGCAALNPAWQPGVRLNGPLAAAEQLFYRKPAFISQYF